MKNFLVLVLSISSLLFSCSKSDSFEGSPSTYDAASSGSGNGQNNAGRITAGEWNDLDHWSFWQDLMLSQDYSGKQDYWSFHTQNRIAVQVENNGLAVPSAKVELMQGTQVLWATYTDNLGQANLWLNLFSASDTMDLSSYSLAVDGNLVSSSITQFTQGINRIELATQPSPSSKVEVCFVVDATGSMSDEIEFLKADLGDVLQRYMDANMSMDLYTSAVFYRDEGDDYLVRKTAFDSDFTNTVDFIKNQHAGGGGDFPEAVHTALNVALNQMQWTPSAHTKIAFLLLDAPPHYTPQVISDLQKSIEKAAENGIKIIPITASGIDKNTEFLMRFMAIATNATYVFITNDSGIGNEHLQASVGDYNVEFLNDLMLRLLQKYSNQ